MELTWQSLLHEQVIGTRIHFCEKELKILYSTPNIDSQKCLLNVYLWSNFQNLSSTKAGKEIYQILKLYFSYIEEQNAEYCVSTELSHSCKKMCCFSSRYQLVPPTE